MSMSQTVSDDLTRNQEATRLIEDHNPEQPFFMYLALQNTHAPLEVCSTSFKYFKHLLHNYFM